MSKKKIRRPQQYKKPRERTFKEWWADQKESTRKRIIWGCVAVLAVIVLLLVYYYGIYDDGSLKVKNDALVNVQENWLVGQRSSGKNSKYYHIADITAPEGYTAAENSLSSGLIQAFAYEKDGLTVNVTPVSRGVQDMVDSVYGTIIGFVGENGSVSQVADYESALGACKYFTYTSNSPDDQGNNHYTRSLVLYAPSDYSDTSILVSALSSADTEDGLAAEDALLTAVTDVLNGITLAAK